MLRVATWAAVSSEAQNTEDKVSIPDQQLAARRKAKELGAVVIDELVVPGISRELLDFPSAVATIEAYEQLKRLVDTHSIDLVIFLNRGRLGRTMSLIEGLALYCLRQDVALYDLSAPPSSLVAREQLHSSGDQLSGVIQSWRYQNELTEMRRRNASGMVNRIKRGNFANHIPYGWKRVFDENGKQSIVIDEAAAEALRLMYDLYLSGLGKVRVAEEMNRLGHRTQNNLFWNADILNVIFRQVWKHAGYVEVNKKRTATGREYAIAKGNQPPIITEELARKFLAEKAERVKHHRAVNTVFHLSRVVRCAKCDCGMSVSSTYSSSGTGVTCSECGRSISFLKVKAALLEWFDNAANGNVLDVADTTTADAMKATISRLQKQIEAAEKAITRAHTAFVDGSMDEAAHKAQVKRKEAERAQLAAQVDEVTTNLRSTESHRQRIEQIEDIASIGHEMLENPNVTAVNAWLREFFLVEFMPDRSIVVSLK